MRIGTSRYTDAIGATGFVNPDGERVVVLLNQSEKEQEYTLREAGKGICGKLAPHTIETICYYN